MTGNGNNGTLFNCVTVAAGISGQALGFDGIDDYVASGFSDVLSNNFTVSVWYKSSQKPALSNAIIERTTDTEAFSELECLRINENGYAEG